MLSPKNVVFLRVQTSVYDPLLIGDKPKWYAHQLQPIEFRVYDDGSSLGTALTSSSSIYSDENPTGKEIWFNFMKFSNLMSDLTMNSLTEWSLRGNCFLTSFNKLIDMLVNRFLCLIDRWEWEWQWWGGEHKLLLLLPQRLCHRYDQQWNRWRYSRYFIIKMCYAAEVLVTCV